MENQQPSNQLSQNNFLTIIDNRGTSERKVHFIPHLKKVLISKY